MQEKTFLEIAGIPLVLFAVLVYYGIRLWIMKDISVIRGSNKPPVKDETMYVKRASALILFLASATLVMTFLLFINVYAALGETVAAIVIFGILWRHMERQYGA